MKFLLISLLLTISFCSAVSMKHHTVKSRRRFRNPHRGFGKPHRGVVKPHRGPGKPHRGVGKPHRGVGKPHRGVGKPHREVGNPHRGVRNPDREVGNTLKLRENPQQTDRCNINVCFAIDGSLSISDQDFESQRLFSLDVTSILIDFPVSYAAVQYSKRIEKVTPLTNDTLSFVLGLLHDTRKLRDRGSAKDIGKGIGYCSGQLDRHPEDLNSIILFTDGGGNRGTGAVHRADRFRLTGGKLFVVGVGLRDDTKLLEIAGGDPSKVLDVNSFLDTLSATKSLADAFPDTCGEIEQP